MSGLVLKTSHFTPKHERFCAKMSARSYPRSALGLRSSCQSPRWSQSSKQVRKCIEERGFVLNISNCYFEKRWFCRKWWICIEQWWLLHKTRGNPRDRWRWWVTMMIFHHRRRGIVHLKWEIVYLKWWILQRTPSAPFRSTSPRWVRFCNAFSFISLEFRSIPPSFWLKFWWKTAGSPEFWFGNGHKW